MKTPEYLKSLSNQLVDGFLKESISLTDGLKKIAESEELNKQQLYRVAEEANVETYLKLANSSEDGYVEFEVADVAKILPEEKIASTVTHELENLPDRQEALAEEFLANFFKKEASAEEVDINFIRMMSGSAERLVTEITEQVGGLTESYLNLTGYLKQAMAQDIGDASQYYQILKEAAPLSYPSLRDTIVSDFQSDYPFMKFDTAEESALPNINKDSEIYKSASVYEEKLIDVTENYYKLAQIQEFLLNQKDKYTDNVLVKVAAEIPKLAAAPSGILKTIVKSTSKFWDKHPRLSTAALVAPPAIMAGAATYKREEGYKRQTEFLKNLRGNVNE